MLRKLIVVSAAPTRGEGSDDRPDGQEYAMPDPTGAPHAPIQQTFEQLEYRLRHVSDLIERVDRFLCSLPLKTPQTVYFDGESGKPAWAVRFTRTSDTWDIWFSKTPDGPGPWSKLPGCALRDRLKALPALSSLVDRVISAQAEVARQIDEHWQNAVSLDEHLKNLGAK